jgi:hypothetical protein
MAQNEYSKIIPTAPFCDFDVDWHASLLDLNFDDESLQ